MTCDERLEALLNRAGQTISDLKPLSLNTQYYWGADSNLVDYASKSREYAQKVVMHLTDIIDRMEIALENVIGERDYLRSRFHCFFCKHYDDMTTTEPCKSCLLSNGDPGFELDEDKPIMPEDWRADDEGQPDAG